ncbi:MAG: hypothetical protein RJB13_855 [Pseudomonadota bacterium]
MWFPLDFPVPTEHFSQRVLTLQATAPKSTNSHIPLAWRTREHKSTLSNLDAQRSDTTTYTKVLSRNAGLAVSPSSGLWFSALYNEDISMVRTVPDSGSWSVGGAHEEFRVREAQARAGFELLNNVQMGFGIRSQTLRAEVLGNLSSAASDTVVYSGSRLGLVAGALIGSPSFSLSLIYQTPVTGKVQIQGESKVSSVPGYLGGALKFIAQSETSLYAQYGIFNPSKNELASSVPLSSNNGRSISPLGVSVDAKLVPTTVLGFGLTQALSSSLSLNFDAVRGGAFESNDAALLVPDEVDPSLIQKDYAIRVGIALNKSDYESQLFIDYSKLNFSGTVNSSKRERRSTSWGVGLRAGVELGG